MGPFSTQTLQPLIAVEKRKSNFLYKKNELSWIISLEKNELHENLLFVLTKLINRPYSKVSKRETQPCFKILSKLGLNCIEKSTEANGTNKEVQ